MLSYSTDIRQIEHKQPELRERIADAKGGGVMSCNVIMDMPDSAVAFFTRNGTRSRAELGAIFVAFMVDRLGYVVPECCQNEVDEVMADFDKLAALTSARRSEPYVFNRADAYEETFA